MANPVTSGSVWTPALPHHLEPEMSNTSVIFTLAIFAALFLMLMSGRSRVLMLRIFLFEALPITD